MKEGCCSKDILEVLSASAVNKLCLPICQGIASRKGLKALGHVGGRQTDACNDTPGEKQAKRRREEDTLSQDSHLPSGHRMLEEGLEQEAEKELNAYLKSHGKRSPRGTDDRARKEQVGAYGPDPRINLVIKSQRNKPQKISSFVLESVARRMASKSRETMALVQGSDGRFSIKSDEELPGHSQSGAWQTSV